MKAFINTKLPFPAETVWQEIKLSRTLVFVSHGLLSFSGSESFPHEWKEGSHVQTRLNFFGLIPAWQHQIFFNKISTNNMLLSTEEAGGWVTQWNHKIRVEKQDIACCTYSDTIEIKAGKFTLFVWCFAMIFYRYRQHRLKKLMTLKIKHDGLSSSREKEKPL